MDGGRENREITDPRILTLAWKPLLAIKAVQGQPLVAFQTVRDTQSHRVCPSSASNLLPEAFQKEPTDSICRIKCLLRPKVVSQSGFDTDGGYATQCYYLLAPVRIRNRRSSPSRYGYILPANPLLEDSDLVAPRNEMTKASRQSQEEEDKQYLRRPTSSIGV